MLYEDEITKCVQDTLINMAREKGCDMPAAEKAIAAICAVTPPDDKMGDVGFPMFALAKAFHASPASIATQASGMVEKAAEHNIADKVIACGPYVNIALNRENATSHCLQRVAEAGERYGASSENGGRVMVEFSCPNTNKPLHLGHLRNDALGESVSRLLTLAGCTVRKVDLINDRGVHIMKSMLAYEKNHENSGDTPETLGVKGDHFVGQCYVEYAKAQANDSSLDKAAEDMLVKWEAGDSGIRELWARMNKWTIDGIAETYKRTGVSFDKVYYESNTYLLGKDEVSKGLDNGVFYRAEDGSVRCDVTQAVGASRDGGAQEKVLLRADGTSVYITQDIGTAIMRHNEWPYDKMIYVVASEQSYHFKVLFYILGKLGYEWASKLYHLSYGLVNLPEGRMKSREGTVVDADDLLDSLHHAAAEAIRERGREAEVGDAEDTAEKVALGALHYYLLAATPIKDMLFDPKQSLSFTGDTGPYLQYMCARISSILRKAEAEGVKAAASSEAAKYLTEDAVWALVKEIGQWPNVVQKAAANCDPSIAAAYLMRCAKAFSKFYDTCPILQAKSAEEKAARLLLAKCTLITMKSAMHVCLVPPLERM